MLKTTSRRSAWDYADSTESVNVEGGGEVEDVEDVQDAEEVEGVAVVEAVRVSTNELRWLPAATHMHIEGSKFRIKECLCRRRRAGRYSPRNPRATHASGLAHARRRP